jgi:hypothetical protein
MNDDPDKIANAALRQRAALIEALEEIEELVESYVDLASKGGPNLAMRVYGVARRALGKES